jgi:hypothetical protein
VIVAMYTSLDEFFRIVKQTSAAVDEASMFSLRSKSKPARRASAITLVVATYALLAAIPATGRAAPGPGEEPQLAFEPGSYDFGLLEANRSSGQTTFQLCNAGSVSAPIYSLNVAARRATR